MYPRGGFSNYGDAPLSRPRFLGYPDQVTQERAYPLNATKHKLAAGQFVYGISLSELTSPVLPLLFAESGYDFIFIDLEHGPNGTRDVADMVWNCRRSGITPLVRVPEPERFFISRFLDIGAQGIVVPRVESIEVVDQIVSYTRYPPEGTRGAALGGRHTDFGRVQDQPATLAEANRQVLVSIQIETSLGLDRVEELVSRPGVDLCFVGPQDLTIALGIPGQFHHQKMDEDMEHIIAVCRRHNVPVGCQSGDLTFSTKWMDGGCTYIMLGNDTMLLREAMTRRIQTVRDHEAKLAGVAKEP
jgi:2-keto-3-deoxy-L-rhamnonate aldolase RhmA